jgi:hypothetical protein
MVKYIVSWKTVNARLPDNDEMRLKLETRFLETVRNSMKFGKLKEFGIFPYGNVGYAVFEGTETELAVEALKYAPYIEFEIHPVIGVDQYLEILTKTRVPITA